MKPMTNKTSKQYYLTGFYQKKLPFIVLAIGCFFYGFSFVLPYTNLIKERHVSTPAAFEHSSSPSKSTKIDSQNEDDHKQPHHPHQDNTTTTHPKEGHNKAPSKKTSHAPSNYKQAKLYHSYLVAYVFYASLVLGALFFVLIQYISRSRWSLTIRRLAEQLMQTSWLLPVLFIPILFGMNDLYHWAHTDASHSDPLLQHKAPYLNKVFFYIRMCIYFVAWFLMCFFYSRSSIKQDQSNNPNITLKLQKYAPLCIVIYAFTVAFFSMDMLMSLSPHWYSTIYCVYYFSGSFMGFLCFVSVVSLWLRTCGYLKQEIKIEHYHDLGKLIFGFVCFWGYIAFSQYMLIWYASIPEETLFYLVRLNYNWKYCTFFLAIGHFALPFIFFISRNMKRNLFTQGFIVIWLIVMHYLDMYWLISPNIDPNHFKIAYTDIFCFLGMGGIFIGFYLYYLSRSALIPMGDPRLKLHVSLHLKNA